MDDEEMDDDDDAPEGGMDDDDEDDDDMEGIFFIDPSIEEPRKQHKNNQGQGQRQ